MKLQSIKANNKNRYFLYFFSIMLNSLAIVYVQIPSYYYMIANHTHILFGKGGTSHERKTHYLYQIHSEIEISTAPKKVLQKIPVLLFYTNKKATNIFYSWLLYYSSKSCCPTKIRTQTNRTKNCCATITPQDKLGCFLLKSGAKIKVCPEISKYFGAFFLICY